MQCPPQLDQRLAARDWRWHCERSYTLPLADGQVELFFIDTSPFVQEYQTAVWSVNEGKLHQAHLQGYPMLCPLHCSCWTAAFNSALKGIRMCFSYYVGGILEQSWQANMKELEVKLARSKAKWKIVIGHHPIKSQLQVGDFMESHGTQQQAASPWSCSACTQGCCRQRPRWGNCQAFPVDAVSPGMGCAAQVALDAWQLSGFENSDETQGAYLSAHCCCRSSRRWAWRWAL